MLTRGQIITEGLNMAGRPDLLSEARLWLNIFLEKMYRTQDWAWCLKTITGGSISQGMSLPSDYLRVKTATLVVNGVPQRKPLIQVGPEEYDSLTNQVAATGNPEKFFVDELLKTVNFWPAATANLAWNCRYYYLPALPDPTDPSTDSQTPIWQEDSEILVQEIIQKAMKYNDDERRDRERGERDDMLTKAKMNSIDMRAGHNRIKLGKSFRRRF